MARARRYGEDLTYAEWHRNALPALYARVGHRLDLADRDWTEFCHHCKEPLALYEEVIDRGQDLADKATTVTRRLAGRAGLPAFLVAPRIERDRETQDEIDSHHRAIRELEARAPIVYFTARQITPDPGQFIRFTPEQWAEQLLILHRTHHETCWRAAHVERPLIADRYLRARERSRLLTSANDRLPF